MKIAYPDMKSIDLKKEFRNFKLSLVQGNIEFKLSPVEKLENELIFISSEFKNDIITGSIALNLYGLLERSYNDIDIIIDNKDRYPFYTKDRYGEDEEICSNRLGHRRINYKRGFFYKKRQYKVDFFLNTGQSYKEILIGDKLVKVHDPVELISQKFKMAESNLKNRGDIKHSIDLLDIFERFGSSDV